ncbi:cell division protein FtsQ/DivIB [Nocardioides sp.]|uniref:cell division protein FtsQ/DivIB n=1 Tax=Nocardioides sp. TaxID=35761 RepID=UPI0039E6A812
MTTDEAAGTEEERKAAKRAARRERRTRRRFARRQWRRRWLRWKPVLAVVLVLAAAGTAVWALWFSSLLSVQAVEITGLHSLKKGEVRRAAAVQLHQPLVGVDLDGVRRRVAALPPVESVEVSRQWPDQVLIEVTERTPIAVAQIGDQLRALDSHGVVFLDYGQQAPEGLPVVRTPEGTSAEALAEAAEVISALPASVTKVVDHVDVRTVDEISLVLTDGRTVVWGSADQSTTKAKVLTSMLPMDVQTIDVSVPGQPTSS